MFAFRENFIQNYRTIFHSPLSYRSFGELLLLTKWENKRGGRKKEKGFQTISKTILIFISLILNPWVDKTSNWPETHSVNLLYLLFHKRGVVETANERNVKPLSATDVLAPTTMKNAAKCDTSCELQNLVSHQNFERNLRFLVKHVCWSVCFIPTEHILLYGSGAGCRCDALKQVSHSHAQMKHHFFGRGNTAENMTWNILTFFDDRRRNHSFRDVILYQILPENESTTIYFNPRHLESDLQSDKITRWI